MWTPESKCALVVVRALSALASPAVTRLWQLSELVQWSDNQHRPFVPSCWVYQRRSHSAPRVLTQTHSCFLTSGHLHFYLSYSPMMHIHTAESIITLVFFCWQHSSQNWQYWPNNTTSKYKLISRFITVNSVRICIVFAAEQTLTHSLLSLHLYHHRSPCNMCHFVFKLWRPGALFCEVFLLGPWITCKLGCLD